VALALAATLVQALPFASMAPRAAADEADGRVTETEASAAARKSGKQVEVVPLGSAARVSARHLVLVAEYQQFDVFR
jgi:hypothetical protein